jgi:hypothetical protein
METLTLDQIQLTFSTHYLILCQNLLGLFLVAEVDFLGSQHSLFLELHLTYSVHHQLKWYNHRFKICQFFLNTPSNCSLTRIRLRLKNFGKILWVLS